MVADHLLCEGAHIFVLGFVERLLARVDVDESGSVGDMSDLRVGRLSVSGDGGAPSARTATAAIAILCMTVPFLWH